LKHHELAVQAVWTGHPLTGGCGLKLPPQPVDFRRPLSPPHGGVWIETHDSRPWRLRRPGHPLTGGCGLKHGFAPGVPRRPQSPPHGGVWIETSPPPLPHPATTSPPHGGVWIETAGQSHQRRSSVCHPLTGGCGLKLHADDGPAAHLRSPPHGGVWIETRHHTLSHIHRSSPPHGGVWIETKRRGGCLTP